MTESSREERTKKEKEKKEKSFINCCSSSTLLFTQGSHISRPVITMIPSFYNFVVIEKV